MVCKLHVEALQCSFGRRSDNETLDEASDWLNTILQAVASQWTSLTTIMMMIMKRMMIIFKSEAETDVRWRKEMPDSTFFH